MTLSLTLACGEYDRTYALRDGTVQPEGIDLTYLPVLATYLPVLSIDLGWHTGDHPPGIAGYGELFRRQARHAEFEVSEFSMSTLMILHSRGDDRFVGIPVFTSRVFRHSAIFINANSGISRPEDLIGKRVGSPEYQQTAALWMRAFLQHDYGVAPDQLEWYFGGLNTPQYSERIPVDLPANVRACVISADQTLDGLLERGEIDALLSAELPESFIRGSQNVRRLFPNYRQVEADYFRRTGFFPIMHTLVLRRDVYVKAPWAAASLYEAFLKAKNIGLHRLGQAGALCCSLPWVLDELAETQQVMGDDFWPYGLAENRKILEAMAHYSYEQGLIKQPIKVEELFAPETR